MRILTAPVTTTLAMLLAACATESGPTAESPGGLTADSHVAEHTTATIPEDGFSVNPCNGETVHFTGTITQQTNVVGAADGTLHIMVAERLVATGTGLTTGLVYRVDARDGANFNSPTGPALNSTFTERDHFRFQAATPGLSFMGSFFLHFVALPSGEFKITRQVDNEDGVCLG